MRKKLFCSISALIMIFALSACGAVINNAPASSKDAQAYGEQSSSSNVSPSNNASSSNSSSFTGTTSQKNAISKAQDYLGFTAFSRQGLIEQLEFEGYSEADATYAVDKCGADWKEQAAKCAANYLDNSAFSRQGLIDQLEYEGFTSDQATYGVDAVGLGSDSSDGGSSSDNSSSGVSVSKENAARAARNYLKSSAFSEKGLVEQLEYEGYSTEDAEYGVAQCGADWNEQAAKCAKNYLDSMPFSRSELIEQLEYEGFTNAQAVHGADAAGL